MSANVRIRPLYEGEEGADGRQGLVLAGLLVAATLDLVDVTIVNVAIPTIQRDLGASYEAVQWVIVGYTLAFALGLVTGGRLGEIPYLMYINGSG